MSHTDQARRSSDHGEGAGTSDQDVLLSKAGDEHDRSSSEDELELGELHPLNEKGHEMSTLGRRRRGRKPASDAAKSAPLDGTSKSERRTARWSKCVIISLTTVGSLLAIIVAGGSWVYKSAPADGQSPPWYPTRKLRAPPQQQIRTKGCYAKALGGTLPEWKDAYQKAEKLVRKMSLVEKVNVTTGVGWQMGMCVGNTGPASQVGFPALCLQDGPLGLRFADHITAFPAGITTGATWNRDLMYKRGRALGLEARLKGINVLLGPSMGPLGRMPAGGRNWEGFGPDPVLQGVAAAETIKGIQDEGVIATAKHYILNEQEHFRQSFEWGLPNALSSNIDDRTLHELYLWPFADSVKAGVASVMCSYQMVNNSYACGNSKLLNGILKDELGFQGFVQSDWLAQRSGVASALAGLDMTMPGDGLTWAQGKSLWGPQLTRAVLNTSLPVSRLDDMATRIVAAWYQLGQDNSTRWPSPPPDGDGGPNFSSWTKDRVGLLHPGSDDKAEGVVNKFVDAQGRGEESHGKLARRIAAEGTVLVKNVDSTLPLSRDGAAEDRKMRIGVFGEDASEGKGPNRCADRGCNQGTLASGWGSGAVDFPYLITPIQALKAAVDPDKISIGDYATNKPPFKKHPGILRDQDMCIVFVNSDGGEGYIANDGIRGDRNDLYLQKGGDGLVRTVAAGCGGGKGKTVVVVHAVGPVVLERWVDMDEVKAVVLANLPGQESGNALVDVLFGDVNPSGKLPYTVGKTLGHYGPGGQILYYPNAAIPQQNFSEGLYMDYRYFDKNDIEPRYEFGYGLSYTTFMLSSLSITTLKPKSAFPSPRPATLPPPTYSDEIPPAREALFPAGFRKLKKYVYPYIESEDDAARGRYPYPKGYSDEQTPSPAGGGEGGNPSLWDIHAEVRATVTNTGKVAGKEVIQLYISFPAGEAEEAGEAAVDFPVKVLRGFEKVELRPGQGTQVTLPLTRRDLSYWSTRRATWVMPSRGNFTVRVGTSSRNLPLVGEW
ncbi:MAG: hypothetical protein M1832_002443 [Thelocarpon impressellum]|nr:MAG: hypothetical protein M1832_002443 [Thelocarpon impressellum]